MNEAELLSISLSLQPVLDICLYVYQLTSSIGPTVCTSGGGEKGRQVQCCVVP